MPLRHVGHARRARLAAVAAVLAAAGLLTAFSTANAGALSRVYHHGSRTDPVVALTFDDGWTPSNCARIDKILQAKGAAATFFPSARWVRRAPSLWKQLATRYPFGDHTSTHPHMKTLSYAQQYDEISSDRRIVEGITGVPLIPVFRAPYGEFDSTTLAAAAAAGFPVTMEWDVNVYDVTGASDAKLLAQAISGHDGSVITMHCGADATVRILPRVIDDYRGRGFRFVTVPELLSGDAAASASASAASPSAPAAASPRPILGVAGALAGPPASRAASKTDAGGIRSIHLLFVLTLAGLAMMVVGLRRHHAIARLQPTGSGGPART